MPFVDILFPLSLGPLTYRCPDPLKEFAEPGMIVSAPLKKDIATGVLLMKTSAAPPRHVKDIAEVHGTRPLFSKPMMKLLMWMSDYSLAPSGIILQQAAPKELLVRVKPKKAAEDFTIDPYDLLPVTEPDIRTCARALGTQSFQSTLLHASSSLQEMSLAASEALGRGRFPGLSESPMELFEIGARLGVESELSKLFRRKALEIVAGRDRLPTLFLNTHPSETAEPGLLESVAGLRRQAPDQPITLEIHEAAVVKTSRIPELRLGLREHEIGLAYDDFGAGQARLLELGEVPPDILKFDTRFVRDIDRAPESKRRMLKSLVDIARDLGVEALAEGIETPGEADACIDLGFTRAQGYHFGRPAPIERL